MHPPNGNLIGHVEQSRCHPARCCFSRSRWSKQQKDVRNTRQRQRMIGRIGGHLWTVAACGGWVCVAALTAHTQQSSAPAAVSGACRVAGRVHSGATPLPGVSILIQVGDALKPQTSTGRDGTFAVALEPGMTHHLVAELTAFSRVERDVTLGD